MLMIDNRPLISYVLTAYNSERYIKEAIECAFLQTYSPLEIILSDDSSTDNTYSIMEEMSRSYVGPHKLSLNRNSRNLGISQHMNKAYLELAHGEIIVVAHADDLSEPDRTEKSWLFLSEHPNITALSFSMRAFSQNESYLSAHSVQVPEVKIYTFETGGNIPAPSRCFYKRVMQTFGPLNEDCPTEDELISFRSLLLGYNALLPEVMVKYRKHALSQSNPENFDKFPLEKILKQQDDDMEKAVALGLISQQMRVEKYEQLHKAMCVRMRYRAFIKSRKLSDLVELIRYRDVKLKRKLHYIKQYCMFLFSKN